MMTIRRAAERGSADHGWLKTRYSFSFADYFDPKHMGFRALRVINDDTIAGGGGFPTHPHRDMEIITFIIEGALEHRDSMGNGSVIGAGEVQVMSAGTGIQHSEFNPSPQTPVKLLQVWLLPSIKGVTPRYDQRSFRELLAKSGAHLLVSGDGRDGSLRIHQDANITLVNVDASRVVMPLAPGRHAWVQVFEGTPQVNDRALGPGDGVALSETERLSIEGQGRMLVFDLA